MAINGRQSATVASFQTTFQQQFGIPSGSDQKVDSTLLKTYAAWIGGDGRTGLRYVLSKGFVE